jgi:GNAT superfamily N-acetyltransferase
MQAKITIVDQPAPELRDVIYERLVAFNEAKAGYANYQTFAALLNDPSTDDQVGGLWGMSAGGWFFVEMIFVPEEYRGRGAGTALMRAAENAAQARGCVGIRLDTFTFQAPEFYEKLGYSEFGRLKNFPPGHERIFYFKAIEGNGVQLEAVLSLP